MEFSDVVTKQLQAYILLAMTPIFTHRVEETRKARKLEPDFMKETISFAKAIIKLTGRLPRERYNASPLQKNLVELNVIISVKCPQIGPFVHINYSVNMVI